MVRTHVRDALAEPSRRVSTLHVLSLACASGEEPYSIAMTLCRTRLSAVAFRSTLLISVPGTRPGTPGGLLGQCLSWCDLSYRSHFFSRHAEGFEINRRNSKMVRFFQGNVLDRQVLEGLATYDVVFCRNLLIYLNTTARASRHLLHSIGLLGIDGRLVIGHADRFEWDGGEPKFSPVGEPGYFV